MVMRLDTRLSQLNINHLRVQVIVIHEYLFTLDQEVLTVWKRHWTASSILLVSVRWVMVVNAALGVVPPLSAVTVRTIIRI